MTDTDFYTVKEFLEKWGDHHEAVHKMEADSRFRELQLADAKFLKANEVREQIDRERGNFVTREMYDTLTERLGLLDKKLDRLSGQLVIVVGGITLLFSALSIILRFVGG